MKSGLSRRRMIRLAGAAALGVSGVIRFSPVRAALAGSYELIDIGETFPDASNPAWTGANDMTSDGIVAGNMWISDEKRSPWIYRDGKLSRIKTGEYGGMLSAINEDGVLCGRELLGWHAADNPWGRPVLWVDGEKDVLSYPDGLPSAPESGRAYDLNRDRVAVGAVQIAGGASYPVIWRDGEPALLPSIFEHGQGAATFINDDGLATGFVDDGAGGTMGVIWDGDAVSPLFTTSGSNGPVQAQGIGPDGLLIGTGWSGAAWEAMVWRDSFSEPVILPQLMAGQLQGTAVSADFSGLIGGAVMVAEGDQRAVIWDGDQVIEVGTLVGNLDGAQLLVTRAFGADGVIASSARYPDNTVHAVLLQPVG